MIHIIAGPEGTGKTKKLVDAIHAALKEQPDGIVCIERGSTLRFDLDHRVRLVDATEYPYGSYTFLKGFISGMHAGNFDIAHIFIDNLYKISKSKDPAETEEFCSWMEQFSAANNVRITCTVSTESGEIPAYFAKYC